jgi:hypothetical protein
LDESPRKASKGAMDMGQYHLTVSLTKREFVHPHALGDGFKLVEQASSGPGGIGSALTLLLAASNGYGGGDFGATDTRGVIGRWAGDRIAVVGDYAEPGDLAPEHEAEIVYDLCGTPHQVLERAAHLAGYARRSGKIQYAERAARLKRSEPYADVTPLVRDYLEREGIAVYGDGEGWIPRKPPY